MWYFYSSLFVECIERLDVYHTSEYCFSRTLITSPEVYKPIGNYSMENGCVRFFFASSEVEEDERDSAVDRLGFVIRIKE